MEGSTSTACRGVGNAHALEGEEILTSGLARSSNSSDATN